MLALRGRYDDAARRFEAALEFQGDDAARAAICGKLGEVALRQGRLKTASAMASRALRLLGQRVPRGRVSFLLALAYEAVVQALHSSLPRLFVGPRRPAEAAAEIAKVRLLMRFSHVFWLGHGLLAAARAHLTYLNSAERGPPGPELGEAYMWHAVTLTAVPWFRRAIDFAERGLRVQTACGSVWDRGRAQHLHGMVLYLASRFREALGTCREAVRLLDRAGDLWEKANAEYSAASSLCALGDLREAADLGRRIHREAMATGATYCAAAGLAVWAEATGGRVPRTLVRAELDRSIESALVASASRYAEGLRLIGEGRPGEAAGALLPEAHTARSVPVILWGMSQGTGIVQRAMALQALARTGDIPRFSEAFGEAFYPYPCPEQEAQRAFEFYSALNLRGILTFDCTASGEQTDHFLYLTWSAAQTQVSPCPALGAAPGVFFAAAWWGYRTAPLWPAHFQAHRTEDQYMSPIGVVTMYNREVGLKEIVMVEGVHDDLIRGDPAAGGYAVRDYVVGKAVKFARRAARREIDEPNTKQTTLEEELRKVVRTGRRLAGR